MGILGRLTAKKSCVPGIISWQNYASEHKFSRPGTPNLASSRSLFLLEGRAVRGRCQNVIKCEDFHILFLLVKRHGSVL